MGESRSRAFRVPAAGRNLSLYLSLTDLGSVTQQRSLRRSLRPYASALLSSNQRSDADNLCRRRRSHSRPADSLPPAPVVLLLSPTIRISMPAPRTHRPYRSSRYRVMLPFFPVSARSAVP